MSGLIRTYVKTIPSKPEDYKSSLMILDRTLAFVRMQ